MADKLSTLIITALGQAALHPAGTPLFASKASSGLFPANVAGRNAARKAQDEGLLVPVAGGRADQFAITPRGVAYYQENTSARQVLDDLARAVEARQTQVSELISAARQMSQELVAIQSLLAKPGPGEVAPNWFHDARVALEDWPSETAGDCPLPELYRRLVDKYPALSIGQFHDGLRQLRESGEIYLHPWTGPLYQLPEPTLALLCGHEIAYYASPCEGRSSTASKPALSALPRPWPRSEEFTPPVSAGEL